MSVEKYPLLRNVHTQLLNPTDGETYLTRESFDYHHYKCDGFNDVVSIFDKISSDLKKCFKTYVS